MKTFREILTEGKLKYTVLGINDDQDFCDHCGKCNLKRVVWLSKLDADGNQMDKPFAVGTDCASRLLMGKQNRKIAGIVFDDARMISLALKWFKKGHPPKVVKDGLWNRFGTPIESFDTGATGIVFTISPDNKNDIVIAMRTSGQMKTFDPKKYIQAKDWVRK